MDFLIRFQSVSASASAVNPKVTEISPLLNADPVNAAVYVFGYVIPESPVLIYPTPAVIEVAEDAATQV